MNRAKTLAMKMCVAMCAAAAPMPATAPSLGAAVRGTTQPAGAATQTSPGAQAASRPSLPPEFAVLQERNVFAHAGGSKKGGSGAAGGPEAGFVLKGVVEADGRFTAFVEDKGSKRVNMMNEGATLASGKIKGMNLDGIDYEVGGNARRIAVGQNLNGEAAPPTPTSKPAGPPGPGQPGQPGGPPGQPAHGGRPGGPPQQMPPGAVVVEHSGG